MKNSFVHAKLVGTDFCDVKMRQGGGWTLSVDVLHVEGMEAGFEGHFGAWWCATWIHKSCSGLA